MIIGLNTNTNFPIINRLGKSEWVTIKSLNLLHMIEPIRNYVNIRGYRVKTLYNRGIPFVFTEIKGVVVTNNKSELLEPYEVKLLYRVASDNIYTVLLKDVSVNKKIEHSS